MTPSSGGIEMRDRRPLYAQVADKIRADFAASPGGASARLPGAIDLAERYQVSRTTIREAQRVLEQEGTIFARHGVGTFVSYQTGRQTYTVDMQSAAGNVLLSPGGATSTSLIGYTFLPLSRALKERFNWPGDTLLRLERIRKRDSQAISYSIETVPAAFAGEVVDQDSLEGSLTETLSRGGFPPHYSDSVLSAVPVPARAAKEMNGLVGKPVIRSLEVMYDAKGQVLAISLDYMDASAVSLRIRRRMT